MKKALRFTVQRDTTIEDSLLHDFGLAPRSALKKGFQAEQILLNGKPAKRTASVTRGDTLEVRAPGVFARADAEIAPNPDLPLNIIALNHDFVVVDKPAGQSAHPLRPSETETTLNAIAGRYLEASKLKLNPNPLEGGLVHRIDRGTSGLLACARTDEGWRALKESWKDPAFEKIYLVWLEGYLDRPGRLELLLEHDPKSRKRMIASASPISSSRSQHDRARLARTSLFPLGTVTLPNHEPATAALVRIHTGVMHQIRASFAALGCPVLGDHLYSKIRSRTPEHRLKLEHLDPLDKRTLEAFNEIRSRIARELSEPHVEDLPPNGFFLHALWLRSSAIAPLEQGLLAPIPPYFG